ncbi:hypothetical protein F2Q70_00042966 [Brassica cretica]|uniref:Uncharacterized protein n=1 Tax=Brassica cretica TaxID=69181 RepID=A0A8S9KIQ9_BRACR|nr:hypothetical protein F2Q70_00042966 [Brassica cretica]
MKEECDLLQAESSPELITTTARRDVDNFSTTNLAHEKPPSCSSHREEAVATVHAAIGVPMKQHTPFKVSPPRARVGHAPLPEIVFAAFTTVLRRRTVAGPPPGHRFAATGPP